MAVLSVVLQLLLLSLGSCIAWKCLKNLVTMNPLSKIAGPAPETWATGSLMSLIDKGGWDYHDKVTKEYGKTFKFSGLFGEEMVYTYDTKALSHILVKDQHLWELTEEFRMMSYKTLGASLFAVTRDRHRKQRKLLNPAFSISHIRNLTPTFHQVVKRLDGSLRQIASEGQAEVDILGWMTRTALEIIGQSGFGYSFDTLESGAVEHPCAKSLKNLLLTLNDPLLTVTRLIFGPLLMDVFPASLERWVVNALPWPKLHELRDMCDIMWDAAKDIVQTTKQGLLKDGAAADKLESGNSIMKLLIKANMEADEKDRMTEEEIMAQLSTLTFAAMDTTSNALARILHLLSERPDAQDKLRKEIIEAAAIHGPELSYEALMGLPYMDAVCKETLRLYAPAPFVFRSPTEDVLLPLASPAKTVNGGEEEIIHVPKGTKVLIQLHFVNKDPEIWGPDAHEWKPERWLAPLPGSVAKAKIPAVFSNMMTFLGGGRACLGFVFSQLEMKVVLSTLLATFKFSLTDKKIIWHVTTVVQPTTEDADILSTGDRKRQLPLNIALL